MPIADPAALAAATQKQILETIETVQATALEGARAVADIVDKIVPASLRPSLPGQSLVPSPAQTISLGFGFVQQLISSQEKFVEQLVTVPFDVVDENSPKTAAARNSK